MNSILSAPQRPFFVFKFAHTLSDCRHCQKYSTLRKSSVSSKGNQYLFFAEKIVSSGGPVMAGDSSHNVLHTLCMFRNAQIPCIHLGRSGDWTSRFCFCFVNELLPHSGVWLLSLWSIVGSIVFVVLWLVADPSLSFS